MAFLFLFLPTAPLLRALRHTEYGQYCDGLGVLVNGKMNHVGKDLDDGGLYVAVAYHDVLGVG